jgi:hypothetical protein
VLFEVLRGLTYANDRHDAVLDRGSDLSRDLLVCLAVQSASLRVSDDDVRTIESLEESP